MELINVLNLEDLDEISMSYDKFCQQNMQTMKFQDLNHELREKIWNGLFTQLSSDKYLKIHDKCLQVLRILSRDKKDLDVIISDERLNIIIEKADLAEAVPPPYTNVTVEALKLLCNLIYNSPGVQIQITKTKCLKNLVTRISYYNETVSNSIMLFDMRILFLITALNIPSRYICKNDCNGDKILIDCLNNLFDRLKDSKELVEIICELFKALFNLNIDADDSTEDQKKINRQLVSTLYKFLTADHVQALDSEELKSHIINLLTVVPISCYDSLVPEVSSDEQKKSKEIYQGLDMSAVWELLKFLDKRLDSPKNLVENTSPAVTTLLKLASSNSRIRKYTRQKVLPPLEDVMTRPEEGTTLKAKLCKLLTFPIMELRDIVAEFLFVLCKHNVGRMIKYTGYGNAAGMFANKGLLGGGQPDTDFSSESEESDTEEYVKYRESINPITGCYEEPKPNPLEGMTEEQKEYEAMKLVNLMDQLTGDGILKPCTIGADGKPKPIEHVLELQKGLDHKFKKNNSDSE
ncbi:synembryn-A [Microplitis mediator]|uniref:synembryn-A n=1 Tax=Microplitis mediator TaxID=375433 RepID=UPI002556D13E|nr:synembryn-A [Microplitis mediator]